MSSGVAELLGLGQGLGSPLLVTAAQAWPQWTEAEPALARIGGPAALEEWTRTRRAAGDLDTVDAVLAAVGRIAARPGRDGPAAAAVLVWVFRAAAQRMAWSLSHLAPIREIEHVVAANLWLACRQLPPHWRHKIAANLLGTVRARAVLDARGSSRQDGTWRRADLVGPDFWATVAHHTSPIEPVVDELLARAVEEAVLSTGEWQLVVDLLAAVEEIAPSRVGRWGGLTSREATAAVAHTSGVAAITVRRRAVRALSALAQAYGPDPALEMSA